MQIVTTSQIVETLLTKGEVVLPDFGEGDRIKIQKHMHQAKKQLAKQGMGVMPEYDGYFIRSYKLLSADSKSAKPKNKETAVIKPSANLENKPAIYKVVHKKSRRNEQQPMFTPKGLTHIAKIYTREVA